MIKIIKGVNILEAKQSVIAHQVNCQSVMGSGVALAIKNMYPQHYLDYMDDKRKPHEKFGTIVKTNCYSTEIFGLYSQLRYGTDKRHTNYSALRDSLIGMIHDTSYDNIALPYLIGCGLAGGDWKIVKNILTEVSNDYSVNFYLYDFMCQSGDEE